MQRETYQRYMHIRGINVQKDLNLGRHLAGKQGFCAPPGAATWLHRSRLYPGHLRTVHGRVSRYSQTIAHVQLSAQQRASWNLWDALTQQLIWTALPP